VFFLLGYRSSSLVGPSQWMQQPIDHVLAATGEAVTRLQPNAIVGLIVSIGDYEITSTPDRRIAHIVEHHDTANVEHLIDVEKINQHVIEGMPAVDEGEVNALPLPNERWQHLLRGVLVKLEERFISGSANVV